MTPNSISCLIFYCSSLGFVSLAGAQGGSLWNVKGGNYLVPQGLLAKAKANLHLSTKITSIQKQVDPTTNKLVYSLQGTGPSLETSTAYNLVIVAVPLEVHLLFIHKLVNIVMCKNDN